MKLAKIAFTLTLVFLTACNSSSSTEKKDTEVTTTSNTKNNKLDSYQAGLAVPDNTQVNHYSILFFGNSHIANIPTFITQLIQYQFPNKTITTKRMPNGDYLADRLNHPDSVNTLLDNTWSHLILQAQKYSQSGSVDYPTTGAQTWIRMAKTQNTTPILFPEHPQRGNTQEAQRVHQLHLSIDEKETSCVAPVGLAWDKVIAINPAITLHASDGNHANLTGQLLSAFVLFEIITGYPADLLPYIDELDVAQETQTLFKQVASETVSEHRNCLS